MADKTDTGKEGGEGTTTTTTQPDFKAELTAANENLAALSKQVTTLTAQIAEKDKELGKWKKKGKERDADVDSKAAEGDADAWQKKLDDQRIEYADKEEGYKTRITTLEGQLKQERVKTPGIAKAAEYFNADQLPLIQIMIERNCDLEEGEIVVKDDSGKVRYSPNNARLKMTMDEYLQELVTKYPSSAKPKGTSGGDPGTGKKTTSTANNGKSYTPEEILRASPADQNRMIAEADAETSKNYLRAISGGGRR